MTSVVRVQTRRIGVYHVLSRIGVVPALIVVLLIAMMFIEPRFFSRLNIINILRNFSLSAIVALGQLIVMIVGGFDLSVGAIVALASVVAAMSMSALVTVAPDAVVLVTIAGVVAALMAGTIVGLANGLVVARLRIAPFMSTLGMLSIGPRYRILSDEGCADLRHAGRVHEWCWTVTASWLTRPILGGSRRRRCYEPGARTDPFWPSYLRRGRAPSRGPSVWYSAGADAGGRLRDQRPVGRRGRGSARGPNWLRTIDAGRNDGHRVDRGGCRGRRVSSGRCRPRGQGGGLGLVPRGSFECSQPCSDRQQIPDACPGRGRHSGCSGGNARTQRNRAS